MPKQGETSTETSKKPSSWDSNPVERIRPPKRPRDSSEPVTYKIELSIMKIALLKENRPQDLLTEDNQDQILERGSVGLQKEKSQS
jgi:hypothetical protein